MRHSRWDIYWGPLGLVWAFMFLGLPVADGVLGNGSAIAEAQTLDQSLTGPSTLGAEINECCRFVAQTFTAGLSGTLGGITIDVRSPINSIFPLHVAIRTVINGVPSTSVLGETTLSSSSAPLSQFITFPQIINIVADVQYAIVVNYEGAPPPGPSQFQGIWGGESGNQYPYGELYASFLDGISWFLPGGADADVHFQTYVNQELKDLIVNRNKLTGNEEKWVRFVAEEVIPELLGDRTDRIETAARSSWWGLKEGIFGLSKPHEHSVCSVLQSNGTSKDVKLKPLEICTPGRAWQVGLAGVQVPNFTEQEVLSIIQALWPGRAVTDVLAEAATFAGYNPTKDTGAAIVSSEGDLRKSWLLRHPVVGLTLVEQNVTGECIETAMSWCYGTGWQATEKYAPTREGTLQSIADLTTIFNILTP